MATLVVLQAKQSNYKLRNSIASSKKHSLNNF